MRLYVQVLMLAALIPAWSGCLPDKVVPVDDGHPADAADTDTDTDTDADTDADTDTDTMTGDTGTTLDCSVLPAVPVQWNTLPDYGEAEDFDFDGDGFKVSVEQTNLVGKDRNGNFQVFSPNLGFLTAGTRSLLDGDTLINDHGSGRVLRIDGTTGAKSTLSGGLSYPNGLEVDDTYAYVADQDTGRVYQIELATGDKTTIASGLRWPNGVILSPDEQTLYVGSFSWLGIVYAIDRLGDRDWDDHRVLIDQPGDSAPGFDGINVDACGNVYVTEWTNGKIWRITPDGAQVDLVADTPSYWIPNMRWGTGADGWNSDVLYVADRDAGNLFALQMGIEGKRHLLAP